MTTVIAPTATAIPALAAAEGDRNGERRSMRAPFLFLCAVATLSGCGDSVVPPAPHPFGLKLEDVAEGLVAPVFAAAPEGDSRLFIVERNGRIRIFANDALLPEPFLDIRSRVNFA